MNAVDHVEDTLRSSLTEANIEQGMVDYMVELVLTSWEDFYASAKAKPRKKKAPVVSDDELAWNCLENAVKDTLIDAQTTVQGEMNDIITTLSMRLHDLVLPPLIPESDDMYVGATCLAILEEDDDWHEAEITSIDDLVSKNLVDVVFVEFGKAQQVPRSLLILPQDLPNDATDEINGCAMCERPMNLTQHHLIPRQMHAKYNKLGYTAEFLNRTIGICRQCHSKIHSCEDNKTLAKEYNTLEKLLTHESIIKYIKYAKKQKARIRPR
ncbi:hypothetical protein THRCLA_11087 [Thraustotheca clavata]|uniref:Tudor domain-containing protein n=1 Tax=Thraustotheca clavata TaxID=74557 RepID=A0A1V9Y8Z2_9STRA|nr:hypothetical protein THRCLA_11087 [Thraustotheca clavata]